MVTMKLDRLFRDAEDALRQSKEWDKAGIALHFVDMSGMFFTMAAAFAEFERNLISERTSTALHFKKSRDEVYGPVPIGFDRQGESLVKNDEEHSVIDRIKAWR